MVSCAHIVSTNKAIDSCKNHFTSGLATIHLDFPIHLWCTILLLATTTLHLLPPYAFNPRLSAEEIIKGVLNYDKKHVLNEKT